MSITTEKETATRTHMTGGILGLHALTSMHPGSGTALGAVDLPVQRERHTGWPTIAGSALKGILRDACRERRKGQEDEFEVRDGKQVLKFSRRDKGNQDKDVVALFGPPTAEADKQAGALSITDARLLAFPVRSLKGVFAWVTCPGVLRRLQRDARMLGMEKLAAFEIKDVPSNQAILPSDCPCLVKDAHSVILEEFDFKQVQNATTDVVAETIHQSLVPERSSPKDAFIKRFLLLNDDDFTHFVRHATEISARIGLDYESKTVKDGALFYQEFLPPETLFYALIIANAERARVRDDSTPRDPNQIMEKLEDYLPEYLQIGGDETTGKGWCATRIAKVTGE